MTDRPRRVSLPRDRRVGWTPRPPVPPGCIDVDRHWDRWVAIVPRPTPDDPHAVVFIPVDDLLRSG